MRDFRFDKAMLKLEPLTVEDLLRLLGAEFTKVYANRHGSKKGYKLIQRPEDA